MNLLPDNSVLEVNHIMYLCRAVALAAAATALIYADTKPLAFEVASIKAAPPPTDGRIMSRTSADKGRITFSNVSLMMLITTAYKIKEHQVEGPAWLYSERYDVTAKFPEGATREQVPEMLQTLLADRFNLKVHKESKVMPSYELIAAKGGPKLTRAETESNLRMMMGPKGRHMTGNVTIQRVAEFLSNALDRPVVDKTGIEGVYQIDLEWSGDDMPRGMRAMGHGGPMGPGGAGGGSTAAAPTGGGGSNEGRPRDESADAPSIFSALQATLGLRLQDKKGPVDLFMIDNIDKVPTEN